MAPTPVLASSIVLCFVPAGSDKEGAGWVPELHSGRFCLKERWDREVKCSLTSAIWGSVWKGRIFWCPWSKLRTLLKSVIEKLHIWPELFVVKRQTGNQKRLWTWTQTTRTTLQPTEQIPIKFYCWFLDARPNCSLPYTSRTLGSVDECPTYISRLYASEEIQSLCRTVTQPLKPKNNFSWKEMEYYSNSLKDTGATSAVFPSL